MPQMSAWRQAQELTRKAEEEAMLAEKKSQEAYVWCVNLFMLGLVLGHWPQHSHLTWVYPVLHFCL